MSQKMVVVSTFFLLILSFSPVPSAQSRVVPDSSHNTTAVFDVAAAIKRTLEALLLRPLNLNHGLIPSQKQTKIPSNSSVFSFPLHPRMALDRSLYQDYRSLLNSRIARDVFRVKLLNEKLQLRAPVTSGESTGSGEYFARIGVGQPVKPFFFVIDTGSDVNWLQCLPCQNCFKQSDPIFDPKSSSSFSPLPCSSQQCQALDLAGCQAGECLYQVTYGDGSFTSGQFATETLTLGDSASISGLGIGCGHDNQGLFVGSAGIIGLGGAPPSLPSQLKATSFSYCLVDLDSASSSTLDFNSVQLSGSVTSPLIKNPQFVTFRYVDVTGLSVGGQLLPIPQASFQIDGSGSGGVIVDSGTTITRFQQDVYNVLRDAFKKLTQNLPPAQGVAIFDTCYDLSSQSKVEVPVVAIHFRGGGSLQLPENNLLAAVDSVGTFCFAFAPITAPISIIGNFQQQKMRVSYDLANSVVGFSTNQC